MFIYVTRAIFGVNPCCILYFSTLWPIFYYFYPSRRQIKVRQLWDESGFNHLKDFLIIIEDKWCIFPINRTIFFKQVHTIAYFKTGDIILMLRYPAIERFYSLFIIFIGACQTGDAVNTSHCFYGTRRGFETRSGYCVIVLEYKFCIKGRLHNTLKLLEQTIVRQNQSSWWFLSIKGRSGGYKTFFWL